MMVAVQVRYSVEAGVLLLGLCVLLGPLLAERLRIPGLIGLVAAGTVLGPFVLAWLQPGGFIATLGVAGLLYLMFVAGIELDLKAFVANRHVALAFGLATFVVPFALSYVVGRFYLGLGLSATALVGAMWASHTVVSYPEVKSAGTDRNRAVGVSLAATVITDVIALVILAVAASSSALVEAPEVADDIAAGTIETSTTLPLWAGLVLLIVVCFGVIPRATRWLFANVLFQRTQRFVWALVAMAAGAIAGLLGGIEGLVGAFLAGIGMNASVPARSELMERIEFIGNALLIPAFLISVGLSIDPAALVDPSTLGLAAIFTSVVLVGKGVAAIAVGVSFRYDRNEVALMTGLTIGQAAATLAIAQVGVETGLFDDRIRYAAIVTVVVTVALASFGTRWAARRVRVSTVTDRSIGDHVMVLAPLPGIAGEGLAALASALVDRDGGMVTPATVRSNRTARTADDGDRGADVARQLADLDRTLIRLGHDTEPVRRVAENLTVGVGDLADEIDATVVVVGLEPQRLASPEIDGELSALASAADVPVVAVTVGVASSGRIVIVDDPRRARDRFERADRELAALVAARLAGTRGSEPIIWDLEAGSTDASGDQSVDTVQNGTSPTLVGRDGDTVVVAACMLRRRTDLAAALTAGSAPRRAVVVVAAPGRPQRRRDRRAAAGPTAAPALA